MLRRLAAAVTSTSVVQMQAIGGVHLQQIRTELIYRRMYPPIANRDGETRNLKRRERVLILEQNTLVKKQGNIEVILAWDIKGLGNRGDVVTVTKRLARNHLLKCGAAVYNTKENIAIFEEERKRSAGVPRQTLTGQKIVDDLAAMTLPIWMNPNVQWTLNKTHVKVACRKVGLMLTEDCIDLPEEPITQLGQITLYITVNNIDRVPVNAVIQQHTKDIPPPLPITVWVDTSRDVMDIVADVYVEKMSTKAAL